MTRGHAVETLTYDELAAVMAWANPFGELVQRAPEPVPLVRPYVSPGRVILAPALSAWDRLTWGAAVFAVRNPDRPVYQLTVRDRLWCYLVAESAAFWTLPDDPLGSTEWIRRERLRPYSELVRGILDDADLRLQVRR